MSGYILVTGASGFVGSHVVEELFSKKKKIIVLVRDKASYKSKGNEVIVEGTLENVESWEYAMRIYLIDTCIHLAWKGIPDYSYENSKANLLYGLNVMEFCKRHNVKHLIITGSCWEYKSPIGAVRTDNILDYSNTFKAAKNSQHMMMHAYCNDNDIQLHWMRLFYVYGPGQREGSLIPHIINCFREGKQPELNGAYNRNDFIYVEDVARAIAKVAVDGNIYSEVLNVGSGYSTGVLDIVQEVAKQMGKSVDSKQYVNNKKSVDFWANAEEMMQAYGWSAETSISQGIARMLHAEEEK